MRFRDLEIIVTVKRIRSLRLIVRPTGEVLLNVPIGVTEEEVERFLSAHYSWILRSQQKMQNREAQQKRIRYESGEIHLFFGKELPLRVEPERGRESVDFRSDEIVMYAHPDRTPMQRKKLLYQGYYVQFMPVFNALFEKWSERLTQEMSPVTRLANPNKYKYFNVSIKLMRTEWVVVRPAIGGCRLISTWCGCRKRVSNMWWCMSLRISTDATIRLLFGRFATGVLQQ